VTPPPACEVTVVLFAPTTVAKQLSALRGLADAVGADAAMKTARVVRRAGGARS
jgi:hypothetical protein